MPGSACGRTTFKMVSSFVAPSARLASRRPGGMAFSDSSVATMTTGIVMTASVSEAQMSAGWPQTALGLCRMASMFLPTKLMKKPRPNRPKTMDGTPARLLTAARMNAGDERSVRRIFREINRRDDADGQHKNRHHKNADGGADNHRQHAGGVGVEEILFRESSRRNAMRGRSSR